jgi:hypothetical protein
MADSDRSPIRVFLSTPGDVSEERRAAQEALSRIDHTRDHHGQIRDKAGKSEGAATTRTALARHQATVNALTEFLDGHPEAEDLLNNLLRRNTRRQRVVTVAWAAGSPLAGWLLNIVAPTSVLAALGRLIGLVH